jgi:hypothetical protein
MFTPRTQNFCPMYQLAKSKENLWSLNVKFPEWCRIITNSTFAHTSEPHQNTVSSNTAGIRLQYTWFRVWSVEYSQLSSADESEVSKQTHSYQLKCLMVWSIAWKLIKHFLKHRTSCKLHSAGKPYSEQHSSGFECLRTVPYSLKTILILQHVLYRHVCGSDIPYDLSHLQN